MTWLHPHIGSWYQDREQGAWFEVVALDEASGTIEVQYFDGSIAEFDRENWQQLTLVGAAAPEDSEAAYEMSAEDRWGEEFNGSARDHLTALAMLEPDSYPAIDDF